MEDRPRETPVDSDEAGEDALKPRPSLAERLMNPPAAGGGSRQPETEPLNESPAETHPVTRDREPPVADPAHLRETFEATNPKGGVFATNSTGLEEARRYVRLRYYSFLLSLFILVATLAVAAGVLVSSLLDDSRWEQQAASGAVAGAALLLLLVIQYRPAGGIVTAAAELAQFDAQATHLEKSYALWDRFLEQRVEGQEISARDVAMAVSSMTAATREMMAAQADLIAPRRGRQATASPRPSVPTPTTPDPGRY